MSIFIGSEWNKWDLHVHTPSAKLNDQYRLEDGDVWQVFYDKIHNSNVSAFGLTDYFSVDNYFRFVGGYYDKYPKSDKVFFPNVEFRLDSKNSNNEHIQVHVIFSNKQSTLDKINPFLTRLPLLSTDDVDCTNKYCTDSDLLSIDYEKAMIQIDILIEKIEADFTPEEYLIIGVANGYGSLRPGRNDGRGGEYAKELDKKCHLFFGTSNNTNFYLNKEYGRSELGLPPKAILSGSDSHSFDDLENKLGKRFNETESEIVWIKSELTFEGLRQIVYEPEYRLSLSGSMPQPPLHKLDSVVLNFDDSVSWDGDKFCFSGSSNPIYFSPYLTCIIGGRGSGKSTLLNLIAEKIGIENGNFFSKLNIQNPSQYINFNPDVVENIEFLAQNTIEKFATNSHSFTNAIYKRLDKKSGGRLLNIENDIASSLNIFDAQVELRQQRLEWHTNLLELKNELRIKHNLVKTFTDEEYLKVKKELDELQRKKIAIESSRNRYKVLFDELKTIAEQYHVVDPPINNYDSYYNEMSLDLKAVFEKYTTKDYSEDKESLKSLGEQIEAKNKTIEVYLKEKGLSDENIQDAQLAGNDIPLIRENIQTILNDIVEIKRRIGSFNTTDIDNKIQNFKETINDELERINATFTEIAEENPSEIKLITVKYELDQDIFENVFEELENKLGIRSRISSFRKAFMDYLREVDFDDVLRIGKGDEFVAKIDNRSTHAYGAIQEIFTIDANFYIYKLLIEKEKRNISDNKILKVYYDGRSMENSSFGQKCTAVIVVLLSLGNNPIIIDEPEAHLDSSLIANYLVELIKKQKSKRQIIFATHNANFVLNADSELVIKLENMDGLTQVKYLTIEDVGNRDNLLKLEGGKEAFRKRERKYNLVGQ